MNFRRNSQHFDGDFVFESKNVHKNRLRRTKIKKTGKSCVEIN